MSVAILDYGMGNLRSVEKAFQHVGVETARTRDHRVVREAGVVVLPGVGAMPRAMRLIRELGFDELLEERREAGVPIVGICMGMQLLFDSTTELGGSEGLGFIPGAVERLDAPGLTVPHTGWSPVRWTRETPLNAGLAQPTAFYHVHSYAPRPADEADVLGVASYGAPFASVASRGTVHGAQFHPEKSGPDGLALLRNVAGLAAGVAA